MRTLQVIGALFIAAPLAAQKPSFRTDDILQSARNGRATQSRSQKHDKIPPGLSVAHGPVELNGPYLSYLQPVMNALAHLGVEHTFPVTKDVNGDVYGAGMAANGKDKELGGRTKTTDRTGPADPRPTCSIRSGIGRDAVRAASVVGSLELAWGCRRC